MLAGLAWEKSNAKDCAAAGTSACWGLQSAHLIDQGIDAVPALLFHGAVADVASVMLCGGRQRLYHVRVC